MCFESFQKQHEVLCGEWLAKKSTEFPVNSLVLSEIYQFWAEFDDFEIELETPLFISLLLAFDGDSSASPVGRSLL